MVFCLAEVALRTTRLRITLDKTAVFHRSDLEIALRNHRTSCRLVLAGISRGQDGSISKFLIEIACRNDTTSCCLVRDGVIRGICLAGEA